MDESATSDIVRGIQTRLSGLGWYTGMIDGMRGPLMDTALRDFKAKHGLRPRARPSSTITLTRLFADDAKPRPRPTRQIAGAAPWFMEAQRLLGTREAPGAANNPVIMDWADDLDLHYPGDDVPWCGLFVAHCMRVGAPLDPQGFNRLGARNWGIFGNPTTPQLGAILTFWRGSRAGWKGHVGFYAGEDADAYVVLGGNQSNAVTRTRIAKDRLLEARWPKSVADPGAGAVSVAMSGALSTNEA